jgi:hypothetical protein
MDEMMGYVFGNLKISEAAIRKINRALKFQNMINRRFVWCGLVTAVGFAVITKTIKEQQEQIKKLGEEIERMQQPTEGCCENCTAE